jgi:hypothetical protein
MDTFVRLAIALVAAILLNDARASTLRCGTHVIRTGDTKLEVLEKCGEPKLKEVVSGADERLVEQWFYRESSRQFTNILTFQGTELIRIEFDSSP